MLTRIPDSWAWMAPDLLRRLLPFAVVVAVVEVGWRPAWLGFSGGQVGAQLAFAAVAAPVLFVAAALVQRWLARRRGALLVPGAPTDALFQAAFYAVNGPIEEAFFRGLVQGGLGLAFGAPVGFVAGTASYVLYHRLGCPWADTLATALIVEEAPAGRRGQAVSVLAVLSGAGTAITVIAYPLVAPHWRWLFAAGGVGLVAAPLIWLRLPEGRVWERVRPSGSALRLLLAPPWRRRLVIIAATTALLAVLLEPAGLFFTLFASQVLRMSPAKISVLIAVSGVAGAASYVAGGYLSDRYGRRAPGAGLTGATAVAASLSFATGTPGFLLGNVLWSSFASAATPVLGAWSGELFPTRARATAEAAGSVAGAVGSVAGLQAVGVLASSAGLGTALELTGVVALAGAALLLLLPETRGSPLPD